ncbi:hypothetical protein [Micromonospora sp. RV43]|uniref:hypothetical protein n=1 Tax=Micromonospora sp. RV43 TaxID=1661387 RepID=UPI00069E597C|nr:hypothetical protein [Micromonospora sp. RV43]
MAAPLITSATLSKAVYAPGEKIVAAVVAAGAEQAQMEVVVSLRNKVTGEISAPVSAGFTIHAPRVGMSTAPGKPTEKMLGTYPRVRYMRDFGTDGADADRLPELPAHGAGKMAAPADCIVHVSWKDDVEQLTGWLNGLTRPVYLTWYHEPMGDVPPATYRTKAARVSQIVASHRNRRLVLGHGPIVTRYWLDEGRGNPTDWWYPGATHYGIDCYSRDTAAYWGPDRMFGVAFGKVRKALPKARLLVPEYGLVRTTTDITGAGRAKAIREHIAWLRQQPDVDAVAYWNNWPEYEISSHELEAQAWRDAQQA